MHKVRWLDGSRIVFSLFSIFMRSETELLQVHQVKIRGNKVPAWWIVDFCMSQVGTQSEDAHKELLAKVAAWGTVLHGFI